MFSGFIHKAARNFQVLLKNNSSVTQRMGGRSSFAEFKREKEFLHGALPKVINTISSPQFTDIPEFAIEIKQILDYNLGDGKCTRGVTTILTYKYLEKPENITEESLELCRILGWCVELFQAYWLILDDIMDKSETRRGRACWYKLPGVGMKAVNDSALMCGIMLKLLKTNFEHLPLYSKIIDIFNDTIIYTGAGQHWDYIMLYQKEKDYIQFTSKFYEVIVKYKTSYYSHVLPVYAGMMLANIGDTESLRKVEKISYKIGSLYQMQNDFMDTFALESETGKLGTDIQEGKCTWLAVTALQKCNEAQRKTFTRYYGSPDPEHVEEIKRLYDELNLPEIYKQEQRIRYDEITRLANDLNSISKAPELFLKLLEVFTGQKQVKTSLYIICEVQSNSWPITMFSGFIHTAARNFQVLLKNNSSVTQRMGGKRSFAEFKREKDFLLGALPEVINTIAANPQFTEIPGFANEIKQILDYNLGDGKCTRGVTTILAYKYLEKPENITEESLELCRILGWCVELFQAYWIILDDIVDRSETRRGRTCWYMLPNVGMRAVNDGVVIYGIMLKFLKSNFKHLPLFSKIMDQFNDALIYTAVGQNLDYAMINQKEKDYVQFTREFYENIAKYKTSYYTHVLPVYLGMMLANIENMEILRKVQEIGFKMGHLHQIQNDFSDAFALECDTGKLGTDIQEGKCSWLAVTALQKCNEAQRKTFTRYYGSPDPEHVEEIKRLYLQLKLPEIYKQEKRMMYDEITRLAQSFNAIPRAPELFLGLLEALSAQK
ncbi:uncharacterized protein [Epargyreus clarus]|uniref:uncharacterized protein n=1 Tax=Epargyreus clarus TaxID=520877 RepID=UPI003C30E810